MNHKNLDFNSPFFELYELTEGIYAAISINDSDAFTGAGIFDLGNFLIVFDTLFYPGGTQDLYRAAKELCDKEPSCIINSHYHGDHVYGNCIFPERIPIISTSATVKAIQENIVEDLKRQQSVAEEELKRREEMLTSDNAPFGEQEIYNDIDFYKRVTHPDFKIRLPDFLINDNIIINGTKKTLHLIPFGVGHTDSDIIAYFPEEKICFMADLLFAILDDSWAPSNTGRFRANDPNKLYEILNSILEMDIDTFIAGHGGICTEQAVQMNIDFIKKYFIQN